MNRLTLDKDLFELSDKEIETSKMMYDGKIIKCLVAPYHMFKDIEDALPYSENTFVFPEREMNINQIKSLISIIVASPKIQEARIVTKDQNIILDMIDGCVRVLTEGGDILPSPCKTLMANIHTIRYELLENEAHQKTKVERSSMTKSINDLISTINDHIDNKKTMSQSDYDTLVSKIDIIGEDLIRVNLREMARDIHVVKVNKPGVTRESELQRLTEELQDLGSKLTGMAPGEFEKEFERIKNEMEELDK